MTLIETRYSYSKDQDEKLSTIKRKHVLCREQMELLEKNSKVKNIQWHLVYVIYRDYTGTADVLPENLLLLPKEKLQLMYGSFKEMAMFSDGKRRKTGIDNLYMKRIDRNTRQIHIRIE